MKKTFSVSLLVLSLLAGSAFAVETSQAVKPKEGCKNSALRADILSGALTDAELKTLQADRAAMRARHQALKQAGQPLSEAARTELGQMRQQFKAKAAALAANAERSPARSEMPANWCVAKGKGGKGRMSMPANLTPAQQQAWQQDRAAMRSKMQAARADGVVDEKERAELQAMRAAMQSKYHSTVVVKP
ncbi:hypothetical protein [Craterilacuibacter sp. RT1T]|uniref:hypothetical protein n=1 Tax=Craterilacuibacter sp. RT1T TaxID=2942211 RepID=UPI0020BEBA63|nr:hypothetical protein [Craterilacuibacter sp. RT1T]MCL6263441.1 hypothetical protein [Craterilacuibacter sp. RT1T]